MKRRFCDECVFMDLDWSINSDSVCTKGHKPTWNYPRNPTDRAWGWKRRCEDFVAEEMST